MNILNLNQQYSSISFIARRKIKSEIHGIDPGASELQVCRVIPSATGSQ
jgi:hypothetical protein